MCNFKILWINLEYLVMKIHDSTMVDNGHQQYLMKYLLHYKTKNCSWDDKYWWTDYFAVQSNPRSYNYKLIDIIFEWDHGIWYWMDQTSTDTWRWYNKKMGDNSGLSGEVNTPVVNVGAVDDNSNPLSHVGLLISWWASSLWQNDVMNSFHV